MYTDVKTILDDASRNNYGVLAASAINLELARGLIAAADELQSPLIILMGQMQMTKHARADVMVPLIRTLAEETNVPVALILDHGRDWEVITHAYRNGFSSIMIDASAYEMEENIRRTKKVIEMCHPQGVAVEAELGHVGQEALGDQTDDSCYTRPEDVTEFLNQTRADCLAIACGTAHGQYPKGVTPEIRFDIIRAVKKVTDVPIALHGGSGSGDENIKKAVEAGINKVNVCTEIFNYVRDEIRKTLEQTPEIDLLSLMSRTEQAAKEIGKHFICLTGSQGKAANFQRKSAFQYGFAQTETDGGE
ncbi:class II fructose-bisphosphate aldolase [Enterocloster bolteae]|uniref:class II fructose-bisphosphate aldolase n=1 Tax=Enterocloster bolteae TaxID=208479 RepID=UPI0028DBE09E|nr:class II fructose-bisphosphate aldolase [Enterocloster bolteae]